MAADPYAWCHAGRLGMKADAVVSEIRKARDEHAKRLGYELDAIVEDFKKREGKDGAPVVSLPPRRTSARRASP